MMMLPLGDEVGVGGLKHIHANIHTERDTEKSLICRIWVHDVKTLKNR